jgi:putative ABC transport system permease protein
MINNYKEITNKYLKANRKRTLLTLIGIVLSVALIASVGFFLIGMQENQIQNAKYNYGAWHLAYSKVDNKLIAKVGSNPKVLNYGLYQTGKCIKVNNNLSVRNVHVSDDGFKLLPYKLKEGRFPQKTNEVIMEKWFISKIKFGAKPGDTVKVLGKKYKLVGIINDSYMNQEEGLGELIERKSSFSDLNTSNLKTILLVNFEVNKEIHSNITEFETLASKKTVQENTNLLMTQGEGLPKPIVIALGIIIGIVTISTIAVIYNSFQISVVERVKQFGLLRAVGATPKQIRRIVLREATFLALIGIPIGVLGGITAIYLISAVFKIIGGGAVPFMISISPTVIVITILVGLFSIYASAFLPAFFAGKISPLVAISSRNSITKESIKRRKNLIVYNVFGFEGSLASKNIKRSKKRYRTTVFSIVISVMLLIIFKSFLDMALNVYGEVNETSEIHFRVENIDGNNRNIVDKINKIPEIKASYEGYNYYGVNAIIDKDMELSSISNIKGIYKSAGNNNNKVLIDSTFTVYDENELEVAKQYLKEGNIDEKTMNKENSVIVIGKNKLYNEAAKKNFYGRIADINAGDEITLKLPYKGTTSKVKVAAVLKKNPFAFEGSENGIKIITTKQVAEKLLKEKVEADDLHIKLKNTKLESSANEKLEKIISKGNNVKLINIIDANRQENSSILMMKILLYGFVIVVSLIGSVNIINTLTTNIILRRREFAALKCIGLTQRGLRKMIVLEGMLYGIIGSIYGSVLGTILSYVMYKQINGVREMAYSIPVNAILIASAGAIAIGYISVLVPLKRIKRENLIETVREDF